MKIAIIDMDSLKNPFWGAGQARATREVGKRLAKRHEVTVYTSKYPGYKDYSENGINYVHVGWLTKFPRLANLLFILHIPFLVKMIRADIIIENFNAPTSVSFAPLFTKIPIVGLPTMFNAIEFTKKYHLPFHWIEKIGFQYYKYLLPYSDIDSAKAVRLNPNIKYKIVPQGVGSEFFQIKQKFPEFILYLGRYDVWQKGIDLLISAYDRVQDKIKYPLVIAGHGPDEKIIHDLVQKHDLSDKVKIVGPVYGIKKKLLLEKALYTAFPSRHDECSLWSLESLASGLPLVRFDLPECKWIIPEVSLIAPKFDVKVYSEAMLKATETDIIRRMRFAARRLARQYRWETVVSEIEDFLVDIVKENEKGTKV